MEDVCCESVISRPQALRWDDDLEHVICIYCSAVWSPNKKLQWMARFFAAFGPKRAAA
jgi:hypothetical protein